MPAAIRSAARRRRATATLAGVAGRRTMLDPLSRRPAKGTIATGNAHPSRPGNRNGPPSADRLLPVRATSASPTPFSRYHGQLRGAGVLALARSVRRRPRHNPSSRQGSAPNLDRRWTGEPMNRAGPSRPGELDAAGARPVDADEPADADEPTGGEARVSTDGDAGPRRPEAEAPRAEVP